MKGRVVSCRVWRSADDANEYAKQMRRFGYGTVVLCVREGREYRVDVYDEPVVLEQMKLDLNPKKEV